MNCVGERHGCSFGCPVRPVIDRGDARTFATVRPTLPAASWEKLGRRRLWLRGIGSRRLGLHPSRGMEAADADQWIKARRRSRRRGRCGSSADARGPASILARIRRTCSVTVAGSCQSLVEFQTSTSNSACEKTWRGARARNASRSNSRAVSSHDLAADADLARRRRRSRGHRSRGRGRRRRSRVAARRELAPRARAARRA